MEKRVFVYGTLMRGGPYEEFLGGRRDVRLLGPARCRGRLYDLGDFPGFVPEGNMWVAGELYRCDGIEDTLKRIDLLEADAGFERRILPVRWRQGEASAWVYVYAGSLSEAVAIPGGSYKSWLRRRSRGVPEDRR